MTQLVKKISFNEQKNVRSIRTYSQNQQELEDIELRGGRSARVEWRAWRQRLEFGSAAVAEAGAVEAGEDRR